MSFQLKYQSILLNKVLSVFSQIRLSTVLDLHTKVSKQISKCRSSQKLFAALTQTIDSFDPPLVFEASAEPVLVVWGKKLWEPAKSY